LLLRVLCEVAAMKSGDHGNSHFAEEIAPAHQLRGIFFWLEAEALGATSPSCRSC
jgi:hypothetical protein